MPKYAILSHILPPSPSGQSVVLGKLLDYLPPEDTCLISGKHYPADAHAAAYVYLPPHTKITPLLARLPGINPEKNTAFHRALRPLLRLYYRLRGGHPVTIDDADYYIDHRAKQLAAILRREHVCVLVTCTGDPYDLPIAQRAGMLTGIPVIPYIFDYYAYQWTGPLADLVQHFEPGAITGAANVIVTNESMAAIYREQYGAASTIIRNPSRLPDLAALDAAPRRLPEEAFNIVYTGSVYSAHYDAFRNLVTALETLNRPAKLHIFTSQPPVRLRAEGIGGEYVVFHDHIPYADVPVIQRQADALFLPLAFDSTIPEVIRTSSPGKVGEYLSVGTPVLVHAPADSFLSWYFREHECGLVVDVPDPAPLAEAVQTLLDDPEAAAAISANAMQRAAADFDLGVIGPRFADLLAAACKEHRA